MPRPGFLLVLAAVALPSLLGGCVPGSHVDASPVAGQVVDRATDRPVVGARVVLTAQPDHEARTQTDGDGRFQLAGFRRLVFTPLPYGMFMAPTGFLRVEAAGYRPYARSEFFRGEDGSPGYFAFDGNGVGSVQHVRVALVRVGR